MHIVAHLPQIPAASAGVHQERFVSASKEMAPQTVSAIELLSVGTQQPLHAGAQIAPRRFHNEMKMVIHEAIGVNLPPSPPAGPGQQLKEELPIGVMSKDCFAPVTTAKHVIDRARILDAQRSGHLAKECSASSFVSILSSDPFLPPSGELLPKQSV